MKVTTEIPTNKIFKEILYPSKLNEKNPLPASHGPDPDLRRTRESIALALYGITAESLARNGLRLTPHALRIVRIISSKLMLYQTSKLAPLEPRTSSKYQTFFICERQDQPGELSFVSGFDDRPLIPLPNFLSFSPTNLIWGRHLSLVSGETTSHSYEITLPSDGVITFKYGLTADGIYRPLQDTDLISEQGAYEGIEVFCQILGINHPFGALYGEAVSAQAQTLKDTSSLSR